MGDQLGEMQDETDGASAPRVDDGVAALNRINGLDYRMAPSLSVVTTRQKQRFPAGNREYRQGQQLECTFSTGSRYIDPMTSYLEFDLQVSFLDGTSPVGETLQWSKIGKLGGSALNLFDSMMLIHASGREMDRLDDLFSQWRNHHNIWTKDSAWYNQEGRLLQGVNITPAAGLYPRPGDETTFANGTVLRVQIPLNQISGIFDTHRLIPSFLIAGGRLSLRVRPMEQAFTIKGNTTTTPAAASVAATTIKNAHLVLETIQLADASTRAMVSLSASQGLEMAFTAVHKQTNVVASQDQFVQVTHAISRANCVVVAHNYKPTVDPRFGQLTSDSLTYSDFTFARFQVRLGGEVMPSQPLTQPDQFYHNALVAYGLHRQRGGGEAATLADFIRAKDTQNQDSGYSISVAVQTLEKSSTLSQSGSPIAANRDLSIDVNLGALPAGVTPEGFLHVFVPHVKLVTVFVDAITVRS